MLEFYKVTVGFEARHLSEDFTRYGLIIKRVRYAKSVDHQSLRFFSGQACWWVFRNPTSKTRDLTIFNSIFFHVSQN